MTARTPDEVSSAIRQKLNTTLPGLSLGPGTIERKVIDACAEAISEASISQYTNSSLLDIDTKSGTELEQMVGIFGFGRLQGRRATGLIRVDLTTQAAQAMQFSTGSQFSSPGRGPNGTSLIFTSTQPAVLARGSFSIDIPVQCTIVGSIGNVGPGAISTLSSSVGALTVTNLTAMTGGVDVETDDELRARFKATFLRNIAGTEDFYSALCLQNKNVSRVAVYGPTRVFRTQATVLSDETLVSTSPSIKYIWPESEVIYKDLGESTEVFYEGFDDYTFTNSPTTPSFRRIVAGDLVPGDIVDVEFEYTSVASRNEPFEGITNKVDIFVNGATPVLVTEKTTISGDSFSTSATSKLYRENFRRVGTNTKPSASNRFMRLGSNPIVSFPQRISLNGTIYTQGVHYFLVRQSNGVSGSEREIAGLEWTSAGPITGTRLTVSYTYNRTPELLNAQLRGTKQITTDVLVRQANYLFLRLNLSIEYQRGYSIQQVNNNIDNVLKSFFSQVGYGTWVEFSDITSIVHQVLGVDNVWVTRQNEGTPVYGVNTFYDSEGKNSAGNYTDDFQLLDGQLPLLLGVNYTRKANR